MHRVGQKYGEMASQEMLNPTAPSPKMCSTLFPELPCRINRTAHCSWCNSSFFICCFLLSIPPPDHCFLHQINLPSFPCLQVSVWETQNKMASHSVRKNPLGAYSDIFPSLLAQLLCNSATNSCLPFLPRLSCEPSKPGLKLVLSCPCLFPYGTDRYCEDAYVSPVPSLSYALTHSPPHPSQSRESFMRAGGLTSLEQQASAFLKCSDVTLPPRMSLTFVPHGSLFPLCWAALLTLLGPLSPTLTHASHINRPGPPRPTMSPVHSSPSEVHLSAASIYPRILLNTGLATVVMACIVLSYLSFKATFQHLCGAAGTLCFNYVTTCFWPLGCELPESRE